jgi:hypothetical protein
VCVFTLNRGFSPGIAGREDIAGRSPTEVEGKCPRVLETFRPVDGSSWAEPPGTNNLLDHDMNCNQRVPSGVEPSMQAIFPILPSDPPLPLRNEARGEGKGGMDREDVLAILVFWGIKWEASHRWRTSHKSPRLSVRCSPFLPFPPKRKKVERDGGNLGRSPHSSIGRGRERGKGKGGMREHPPLPSSLLLLHTFPHSNY